ncbi:hypothetical protein LPB19_10915 [Marinobacter salinisoli]|uniref:Tetratricopeptide repeat protein n=1 Tax=Marinobacter salinisoli TaxID=2769486 RepID=A0ABX7MNI4_9GAMM|nr:hypothetical protein [Marinobacter salinisoli]QSP93713.1 hypothetical protein LPB19_10915 [Marinobacter salinisoli]
MKGSVGKKLVLGLLGAAFALAAPASIQAKGSSPENLVNGLVRFALASNQLAPVLAQVGSLEGHSADFHRAQVLLATGQTEAAVHRLGAVVEGDFHRAEAALLLGRTLMEDNAADATKWLELVARTGRGETKTEASFYLAERYRTSGRVDKAGEVLGKIDPGYWAAVGYLNLASDYAREDVNPVRALVALRVALAMADADPLQERREHLKGELLVRAGYLAFKNGEYDKAISFLERVSLEGSNNYTAQALYLHGLAMAAKGSHRASMQSWHRAKKYPLAYPGVADAWIGMGRGYDLSGYLGQAGEAFLAATSAFESERVTLRNLAGQIRQNGAYATFVEEARDKGVEWFLADNRIKTQPRLAYLHEFLQREDAQKAVARMVELAELERHLDRQANDLGVFTDALRSQLNTLAQQSPDVISGALARQKSLYKELSALSSMALSPGQRAQVVAMTEILTATATDLKSFGKSVKSQPAMLERQLANARSQESSTRKLLGKLAVLRREAADQLDRLALAYVAEQDRRMVIVQDKAEQQIAHLYEYLAVSKLEGRAP